MKPKHRAKKSKTAKKSKSVRAERARLAAVAREISERGRSQDILDTRHRPTEQSRLEVSICRLARMLDEEIAASQRLSVDALYSIYSYEMGQRPAELRRDLIVRAFTEAMSGKAYAIKEFDKLCELPVLTGRNSRAMFDDVPPEKLGKKARAQADSLTAQDGTDWDDLLPKSSSVQ